VDRCKTFFHERNGSIFCFIDVQCADETTGFIHSVNFDFNITLHISTGCELGGFRTIWLAFVGRISCGARCSDACVKMLVAVVSMEVAVTYHPEPMLMSDFPSGERFCDMFM
jgi:hypothetical protein